jgi:hypothetical protein
MVKQYLHSLKVRDVECHIAMLELGEQFDTCHIVNCAARIPNSKMAIKIARTFTRWMCLTSDGLTDSSMPIFAISFQDSFIKSGAIEIVRCPLFQLSGHLLGY